MSDLATLRNRWNMSDEDFEKKSRALNQEYYNALELGPQAFHKLSELHSDQLEHYLRETCVLDKVLPPADISADECEVGPTQDTLYKRIWFQMETRAYLGSFEGTPREVQEVYVPRIFLSFFLLQSPQYVINDYNILAYPFPIAKQVEDNIGMDMHEAKDWTMLDRLEQALLASRATYNNVIRGVQAAADITTNGVGVTGFRGELEREDLINLKKYFAGTRSRLSRVIVPESDYIDLERLELNDFGDQMVERVFRDGLDQDRIHGVQVIRTIKIDQTRGDVFRTGNIYAFAAPNEIGRNYNLRGLKFYLERDHQYLYFDAQMACGFIWAVPSRIAKLELYNGGRTTAGALVANFSATEPGSDARFGDPSEVTSKDYFDVDQEFFRPNIRFV